MDVKTKSLFYNTARKIGCLFFLLSFSISVFAEQQTAVLHPQGLLWKIQKDDRADSYLFGTMHISDSRVIKLLSVLQQALKETDVFAMEVVLNDAAQTAISKASIFAHDELLQDYIDDLQLSRINSIMYQYYGVNPDDVNKMKPWAVMVTLSSPPPQSNKNVLDLEIRNLAQEFSHKVVGLETIEEQIDALSGMPMSDQLWLLNKSVNDFETSITLWETMIENYLQRDLQALMKEQEALMDDTSQIDDRFMEKLVDQRNSKMAERLIALMQKSSVFAAIGALHLPGEKGVLHLLERAGYQVAPVY